MEIISGIGTAFAIRSYYKTLMDYFDPSIKKTRKRIKNDYFEYNMDLDGDLLFWRDFLKNDFYNPVDKSIEDFSKPLRIGDMVELQNSNISRWVPFFPGKRCSIEGKMVIDRHNKTFPKHHEYGLEEELVSRNESCVLSGSAAVRLLPFNHQYLLCASGVLCEMGIPILLSEKIYENGIQEVISKEGCVNANIIGTLSELPWEWKERMEGDSFNKNSQSIYGLPRVVLKVDSIKKIGTAEEVIAQAWTQFVDREYKHTALMNSVFTPKEPEDIQKAVNVIANYKQFLESGLIGGKWEIDTEFDEVRNWFGAGKYRMHEAQMIELFFSYYNSNPLGKRVKSSNKVDEI